MKNKTTIIIFVIILLISVGVNIYLYIASNTQQNISEENNFTLSLDAEKFKTTQDAIDAFYGSGSEQNVIQQWLDADPQLGESHVADVISFLDYCEANQDKKDDITFFRTQLLSECDENICDQFSGVDDQNMALKIEDVMKSMYTDAQGNPDLLDEYKTPYRYFGFGKYIIDSSQQKLSCEAILKQYEL